MLCFHTSIILQDSAKNQTTCYIYGSGTWQEGLKFCDALHPNAIMIQEQSEDEGKQHRQESGQKDKVAFTQIILIVT